jgi:hypothetical protein
MSAKTPPARHDGPSIIPTRWRGQRGWLLRWREPDSLAWGDREARVKKSYWFIDRDEAAVVLDAMRRGARFEHALWAMRDRLAQASS